MRNFWAVGACFGGVNNKSQEFIDNSEWYDGYAAENDNRYSKLLSEVKKGGCLNIKIESS